MGWDSLLNGDKDSSQKAIHTILSKIYDHINEILALVKEDRESLNEISEKLSSLEERLTALEKREKKERYHSQ
jgi:flagellin-specific chaperone FliS